MGRASAGRSDDPALLDRMMNAKTRLIGVDVQALNAQVEAKTRLKHQQKTEEQLTASSAAATAGRLAMNQADAAARRRRWDTEVAAFRSAAQGKHTTREYDLNRPDARRLDLPARLGDDDPRCGPASLQAFAGEDLTAKERVAAQQQQCRTWWDEQAAEAERQRLQHLQDKQQLAAATRSLDALQLSLKAEEESARAQHAAQAAAVNSQLQALKAAGAQAAREAEAQAKLAELMAAAADPWLNEDPSQAASALSPARVRKDHWKGMSAEQTAAIKQQQAAQAEQKRDAAAAAAAAEAQAAAQQRSVQRAVLLQAQAAELARRQQAAASAAALKQQIADKAARDATTKRLYANQVTDDYFRQFGRSAR